MSTELTTSEADDTLLQQFYTAAQASGTGSQALDILLAKGLVGKKMPKELKSKKAAEAFQTAFDLIGGIPRLALWADKNEDQFFSLYSKLVPATVKAEVAGKIVIEAPWMSPNRLNYRDAREAGVEVTEVKEIPHKPSAGSEK